MIAKFSTFRFTHWFEHSLVAVIITAVLSICSQSSGWKSIAIALSLCLLIGHNAWLIARIRSIRQQAEVELHQSENRFHQLFDQAPFVIQTFAPDGRALQVNQAWETVWGASRSVLASYNILQDAQIIELGLLPTFQQAFAGEPTTTPPFFYNPAANGFSGRSRWLEWTSYCIKNATGEVEQVVIITKDVTDRKEAEAALLLSEKRLRQANATLENRVAQRTAALQQANIQLQTAEERWQLALAGNQDGIWDWNIVTGETFGSPQWYRLLGFEPNEIQFSYQKWQDQLHPDDRDRVTTAKIIYLAQQSSIYSTEFRFRCKDGEYRWFQSKAQAVWNEQGEPLRMVGSLRNIDDRKEAEAAIAHSLSTLRATLEATADGIVVFDRHLNITHFNQRFLTLWQIEAETIAAMSDRQLVARMQPQFVEAEAFAAQVKAEHYDLTQIDRSLWRLKDGRTFERYSQPQWLNQEAIGRVVSYRDITERQRMAEAFEQSEIRYRAIVEDQTELIARYLPDGTLTFVNQAYALYFGQSPQDLIGGHYQPIVFEADRDRVAQQVASMSAENPVVVIENRVVVNDEVRWTQWHNRMLFDAQGRFLEFQSVGRDITNLKQAEETLFQEKELAQVTLQSIGDAVITTDAAGNVEYLNPVAEALTGWSNASAHKLPLTDVFRIVHETTREPVQNPIDQALQENRIVGLANHTVLIARNGQEIAIEDSAAPIRNRDGQIIGAVMVFHDVTRTRTLSRQLSWQASHDALTGLVNRREFERQLEQALRLARLGHQTDALCFLDLDRFKIVNDTCGHAAGDELLRQIAMRLQEKIRKSDTLARLGGDEFGVLLRRCSIEQAQRIANELREAVQAFRFVWQAQIFSIGVSIGLVDINTHSESLSELLSTADAACYAAKNRGRNRVQVACTNDQERLQQRGEMQWLSRIAQALETEPDKPATTPHDCFCLYTQSIAAIRPTVQDGNHYEVLLRLQDEQGNIVPPMAFIPAAERYNLMHLIDRWVIRRLFRDWSSVLRDQNSIYAINLSGSSINDDQFIHFLHEQFAASAVAPQRICFEITETVAIANLTKARQFITELQRLGCRFALDDFGAGMSSFAYLKSLPVDYLKIDGGFIRNITENSVDDAIVAAITHIGSVMGIRTIAEFVENDRILQRIITLGIDYAQGYGIAKPRPLLSS